MAHSTELSNKSVAILRTVLVTHTTSNGHQRMLDGVALRTTEFHLDCFCRVWSAAPSIVADATVTGFIHMDAGAVLVLQMDSCGRLYSSETFFPLLRETAEHELDGQPHSS